MRHNPQVLDVLLARAETRQQFADPTQWKALRERAGLTQRELADVLQVDRVTVSRWETASRRPRGHLLDAYLAVLRRLA